MTPTVGRPLALPTWAVFALFWAVAYLLFANTFGHAWTYDDFPVIVDNPDIRSWGAFLQDARPGRPLRELSFLFDYLLFGLEPAGWRIQQIFWHGLNGALIALLVRELGGSLRLGLLAGLLFLCHPLSVEVVANLSHRKDSLLLSFVLLAIWAYRRFLNPATTARRLAWLSVAVGTTVLACLAKQAGVVLPGLFVACELIFCRREQRVLARSPWLLALTGLLLAGLAVYWFGRGDIAESYQRGMTKLLHLRCGWTGPVTLGLYLLMVLKSWAFLWAKLCWPNDLALEYTYPLPVGFWDPWVLLCLVLLGTALWLFIRAGRHEPLVRFALIWFALFWLPVANLWPLTYFAADRYLYVPAVGFCLLAALGLERIIRRWRLEGWLLAAALVLVCCLLTWQQNRVWASSMSLWQQAVRVSPEATFALNNLGWNYLQLGSEEEAEALFLRAARNPYNPNPHDNLGWLYEQRGDWPRAVQHYRRFIELAGKNSRYRERSVFLQQYLAQQQRLRHE